MCYLTLGLTKSRTHNQYITVGQKNNTNALYISRTYKHTNVHITVGRTDALYKSRTQEQYKCELSEMMLSATKRDNVIEL
jgi:hypothetical protein